MQRPVLALLAAVGLMVPLRTFAQATVPQAARTTAPQTVAELWADFDPRRDDLDVQIIREWERGGIVCQTLTFHVGTFLGQPARMAAFLAWPKGAGSEEGGSEGAGPPMANRVPGLLHLHGGGQRAFLHEVEFQARRGYACLSLNWGGREMENAEPGDPNTAWGAVDPTQTNVPGYFTLLPGNRTLDSVESPRNNNWYLLTLGARRGLTLLERQPVVDADRLGVYGHSMGGSLTVYVAGTDSRVKAAVPAVGGSGFRTRPWPLLPRVTLERPTGEARLFEATLGFEAYAPHIQTPLLWLGSTNDFHGILDDTCRTGQLIRNPHVRYAFAPHLNHRFTPEFAVTRPLWFDHFLKSGPPLPRTPGSLLVLTTSDQIPEFQVTPDPAQPPVEVRVHYAIDPEPRARFWRTADARQVGGTWLAKLPILSVDQPLFAFANVAYAVPKRESEPHAAPTERFTISSLLQTAEPRALRDHHVRATDQPDQVIDDFVHGLRDWYVLEGANPHHWEFSTRKLADPKWQGQAGQQLSLTLEVEQPNSLVIVLTENVFRPYRGPSREFVAVVPLAGGPQPARITLGPGDFRAPDGAMLDSWKQIDLLSLRAYHERAGRLLGSKAWAGGQPRLRKIEWQER